MPTHPNLGKLACILVLTFLGSCTPDSDLVDITISQEDIELQDKLIGLSGSLEYYALPDSDDYSNIPADPKNQLTDEKVLLGKLLFHETGISIKPKNESNKGTYSCASCHHSAAGFQSGMKQGIGDGGSGFGFIGEGRTIDADYTPEMIDVQPIKSPTVLNVAYQKVMLWNGQFGATGLNAGTEANWQAGTPKETNNLGFEGVEIQAIAGLTVHRMGITKEFCDEFGYTTMFDAAFPEIPKEDRYSMQNMGLAIAAYERTVLSSQSNFQKWLKGNTDAMSSKEKQGASIFFGKGQCYECHSGPALNSEAFYALGMKDLAGPSVHGVVDAATRKGRGGFTGNINDDYKFKVPQLYNLKDAGFFGHGASFTTIKEVLAYKNRGEKENFNVPDNQVSTEFKPLDLSLDEIDLLAEFLERSLTDTNLNRYAPLSLPTSKCFPNADEKSMEDLNCGN